MAKVLKQYEWRRPGPEFQYPWDKWFNGEIWRLEQGSDFTCQVTSLLNLIRRTAKSKNVRVRISRESDKVLVIQAKPH